MATRAKGRRPQYFEASDVSDGEDAPKRSPRKTPAKRKRKQDEDESDIPTQKSKVSKRSTRRKEAKSSEDEYHSDALHSDALDDDAPKQSPKKRSPRKRAKVSGDEDDDEALELKDGQKIIGRVIEAPITGTVPAGQISSNTFNFLRKLQDPKYNDREWFKLHDAVYRQAEKEWKDFVEAFTDALIEVDPEVPPLPPKDVIHRIYRDIRFSNDKTPYKNNFSASFSRSGRKGIFAGFKPGNGTLIAAGSWCPGKNELASIRANIQRNPRRLRQVISAPDFVKWFGEPKHGDEDRRQNIFGMEDELKVAPKGVDKDHKDIDLLKCRSFAVVHRFLDSEVLDPNFKQTLADVARVVMPFIHCLNDMMTVSAAESDGEGEEDGNE